VADFGEEQGDDCGLTPAPRGPGEDAVTSVLLDREHERSTLVDLLSAVHQGESRVLVVRGDAGVGKTALLEHVLASATGTRLLRAQGVESEMELAFAALHQLCGPLLELLPDLPAPQRAALETIFGHRAGPAPDQFLVGLAVLSLLAGAASEQPSICLVEDAQWLDRASAQVLGFVARRLRAESILMVFVTRAPRGELPVLEGLPQLEVAGLVDSDARVLLGSMTSAPLDRRVVDRILAEARGNPLALLELPRGPAAEQLVGRARTRGREPLSSRLQETFLARAAELPDQARLLMLVAAAEPMGDAALLWRAAHQLDIDGDAASADEFKALLTIDDRVTFRHPLVRSAVYQGATVADRRRVHRAIAEVTDALADPDRRAWHRASAATGPDEAVAEELELSAERAQSRGGLVAAAAFLQRSVALTEEPSLRVRRARAAARVSLHAGEFDLAARMLTLVETAATEDDQTAHALLLRAQLAFASGRARESIRLFMSAADQLQELDPTVARETYLEAWAAAVFAGEPGGDTSLLAVSAAAARLPQVADPGPAGVLLEGLSKCITEGRVAAAPLLRRSMDFFASPDLSVEDSLRWGWMMGSPPSLLWDEKALRQIMQRQIDLMRGAGALARLPVLLSSLAIVAAWRGDFAGAAAAKAEMDAVVEATGTRIAPYGAMLVSALRGRTEEATTLFDTVIEEAGTVGQGFEVQFTRWTRAVLLNGVGSYELAFAAAEQASAEQPELLVSAWALPELVEAGVRSGHEAAARQALERLAEAAAAAETDWAWGAEARSRALLSEGDEAEGCYRTAVERLARTELRPELARAHLLHGEWLRRQDRRSEARDALRSAYALFDAIGMEAFAERARRELLATGEKVRRRTEETRTDLTAQEQQIATLAAEGRTNQEIGERLYLSTRTVEWHLRKIFAKLGITSRRALRGAMPGPTPPDHS
jgi:DNA-binding CsgD family transcriptional regulator